MSNVSSSDNTIAYFGKTFQESTNPNSFAALRKDGSVITWGWSDSGGDSSSVSSALQDSVKQIYSSWRGFAALKADGSVISWGNEGRSNYC